MSFVCPRAAVFILAAVLASAQEPAPTLQVRITEGEGAVVPRNGTSPRRFQASVTDAAGRPVPNVTLIFRLPPEDPSGRFASGLLSESLLTDSEGKGEVSGIVWNDLPGKLEIRVIATSGNRRGEALIPVEISATLAPTRQPALYRTPSHSKKWLIIGAVAGGVLASLAVAGRSSPPAVAAPPAPPIVTPSIGVPAITVGKPQ